MTAPSPDALREKARAVYDKLGRGSTADEAAIHAALLSVRNEAIAEERERAARIVESSMLCGDEHCEVLKPRDNPGNKLGLAYAAAIRARA
jgi:hypothetical protein